MTDDELAAAIKRNVRIANDPNTPADVARAARHALHRLGASELAPSGDDQ
jgi:hypothetical protein